LVFQGGNDKNGKSLDLPKLLPIGKFFMGVEQAVEMVSISEAQRRLGLSKNTWLRRRKALGIRRYGYDVNWIDVLRAFTNQPTNERKSK
jgi:hypothetical protein